MFGLGTTELLIIGLIVLFIFGAKRLPEIGKGLGGAIKEFRKVKKDISLNDKEEGTKENEEEKKSLESKLVEKVIEDVPVVKKGLAVKKKAEKIKKIIE
ncbi:MAG: twin-arginine translocase TatA/TatE family subunit [Deltaproteobacteria bacterium]|nr:MAG: twin-arginine translocase TatA/TatE family subunit [Deltaproteobacteria bacterium]